MRKISQNIHYNIYYISDAVYAVLTIRAKKKSPAYFHMDKFNLFLNRGSGQTTLHYLSNRRTCALIFWEIFQKNLLNKQLFFMLYPKNPILYPVCL